MVRILPPDDIDKIAGNVALDILAGLGALSTTVYSAAWLKDRAKRQAWEKRIEEQLSTSRKPMTSNIPEDTPIVIVDQTKKTASLLVSMAKSRSRL